eukprot:9347276-Heterocapsa_arctica.AAC.1
MYVRAAVCCALCAPAMRYRCIPSPLCAYLLDCMGLNAIRDICSLVRIDRRPAPIRDQRRPERHVHV